MNTIRAFLSKIRAGEILSFLSLSPGIREDFLMLHIYIYIYYIYIIYIYVYMYVCIQHICRYCIYIYIYIYPFTRDYLRYVYTPKPLSLIQAFLINVYLKTKNNFQNDYFNFSRWNFWAWLNQLSDFTF